MNRGSHTFSISMTFLLIHWCSGFTTEVWVGLISLSAPDCVGAACDGQIFWDTPGSLTTFTMQTYYAQGIVFNDNKVTGSCAARGSGGGGGVFNDRPCYADDSQSYICEMAC